MFVLATLVGLYRRDRRGRAPSGGLRESGRLRGSYGAPGRQGYIEMAPAVVRLWEAGRRSGWGHCRAARLGLQFFHLPQGAVAIEATGGLALGSTGG
jgi:hypothetical protein